MIPTAEAIVNTENTITKVIPKSMVPNESIGTGYDLTILAK